jgi:hypothetical protein
MEPEGSFTIATTDPYPNKTDSILWPWVTFCNKLVFHGKEVYALAQPPSWKITPFQLSATGYSLFVYISGGCLLHLQP